MLAALFDGVLKFHNYKPNPMNQRNNIKDVILGQSLSSDAVLSIEMDQPAAAPGWKMVAQTLQRREEGENCSLCAPLAVKIVRR